MEETSETKGSSTLKKRPLKVKEGNAASFTQKQELALLKEYGRYRSKFGNKNDWERFHEMSELKEKYSRTQLSEKIRRLKEKFDRDRFDITDPREARIFELCKSVWGDTDTNAKQRDEKGTVPDPGLNPHDFPRLAEFMGDGNVPEILRRNWGIMGREAAMGFETRWAALSEKEVGLSVEKLTLKVQVCELLSNIINAPVHSSGDDEQA